MDLKEFHLKSVKESEYHYCFLDSIRKVNYTYVLLQWASYDGQV